ncbi:hypothetical protein B566_EDAN005120 [Ephemera danica]|nr:hypothetical protein B566_EDAN005120 [Ephemera danica]
MEAKEHPLAPTKMKSLIYAVLLILLVWNGNSEASKQRLNCGIIEENLEGSSPGSEAWRTMANVSRKDAPSCLTLMKNQVQVEMNASLTYLSMTTWTSGTHALKKALELEINVTNLIRNIIITCENNKNDAGYAPKGSDYHDSVNRPGFAKFFFHSANEEREHATKFLEYLAMRGEFAENLAENGIQHMLDYKPTWKSGTHALKVALELEIKVTKQIRKIITTCEKGENNRNDISGYQPNGNDYHLVDYLTGEFMDEQHKGQRELAGMISTLNKMHHAKGSLAEFLFDKKLLKGELF